MQGRIVKDIWGCVLSFENVWTELLDEMLCAHVQGFYSYRAECEHGFRFMNSTKTNMHNRLRKFRLTTWTSGGQPAAQSYMRGTRGTFEFSKILHWVFSLTVSINMNESVTPWWNWSRFWPLGRVRKLGDMAEESWIGLGLRETWLSELETHNSCILMYTVSPGFAL